MYGTRFQELIDNRKWWIDAEKKNKFGTTNLLAGLYSDQSHFIYEILQNAEDAGAKRVSFHLFDDRLEICHNGRNFTFEDVDAITSIGKTTKEEDLNAIGRFGIGFKSVFGITNTPCIYSGTFNFKIKDFVMPSPLEINDCEEETKIILPFDHQKYNPTDSFNRIQARLKGMGLHTLLFLRNIEGIEWKIREDETGYYRKETEDVEEHIRRKTLSSEVNSEEKDEEYIVLERPTVVDDKELKVEIAFKVEVNNINEKSIVPINNAKLAVFFLTDKETHLKFRIQGPYRTTPARDNIPLDENENKRFVEETAILVAESIYSVKKLGLLNVEFLTTLPINPYMFENSGFGSIYNEVKEKLNSDEELLPAYKTGYASADDALLARGKDLRDLLSSEQLELLFNRTKWLDENVTEDKHHGLRKYLMEELNIPEIDPERFSKALKSNEDFIKEQDDEWIKRFYAFLLDHEALWRTLRLAPIIRLEDGRHTAPFDVMGGKPLAYLPSDFKTYFPNTVKEKIVEDEKATEFLRKIGLTEPDAIAGVIDIVLPDYQKDPITVDDKVNMTHVEWISKTLKSGSSSDARRGELLWKLKETPFLWAKNIANSQSGYKKPADIHLGEIYTRTEDLEIYFEENDSTWFLDERYLNVIDASALETVGCKTKVQVDHKNCRWQDGYVILVDRHGEHKRGLGCFDSDCEIEGLEYALEHINFEKAKIIWGILKKHYKRIYGTVESSTRNDFSGSTEENKFSKMGDLLSRYSWIPDIGRNFRKPSEILLSELPDEFDKKDLEAKSVAEKLKFKTDAEQQILEQLPIEKRKRYEMVDKLYQNMPEDEVNKILEKLIEQNPDEPDDFSIQDMATKFKESLVTSEPLPADNTQDERWIDSTPEEEEQIRNECGNGFRNRSEGTKLLKESKVVEDSKIIDSIDPKEFLFEQYGGRCQICNTRLDLGGDKRPYFEIFRISETRGENPWTNMEFNVLCLCPNCHAILKHGGRDLSNVWEVANKVLKEEIAPDPVDERRGGFYIVKIRVVEKEKELFCSPTHINKIAAFIEQSTDNANEGE